MNDRSDSSAATAPPPSSLGRWKVREVDRALVGTDSVGERRAEMVRRAFGPEAAAARDEAIATWRSRTSVSHPALRAVLDAGAWQDDAFLALEALEAPTQTLQTFAASDADSPARLRVVGDLLGAASVLAHHHLLLPEVNVVVDGYGQAKLLGLEDAETGEGLDPRILRAAASLDPDAARAERIRNASPADIEAIARELARDGKVVATSFASDAARGETALGPAARGSQMQIALVLIGVALLVVAVFAFFATR